MIENSQLKAMNFSQAPPSHWWAFFSNGMAGYKRKTLEDHFQSSPTDEFWLDRLLGQGQIDAIYQLPDTEWTQRTEHHRAGGLISD